VRIDEITLHPRDNAMVLATHGRALWILDHLEAIQEYAAAHAATTDAKLFTPPPYAMFRRPARDRNYEFWGDQTFYGENPPTAAVRGAAEGAEPVRSGLRRWRRLRGRRVRRRRPAAERPVRPRRHLQDRARRRRQDRRYEDAEGHRRSGSAAHVRRAQADVRH